MNRHFLLAVAVILLFVVVTIGIMPLNTAATDKNKTANAITFVGIVEWEYKPLAWDRDVPNCDHFALYDTTDHINYELDDARKAAPYEGKRVKVTGILDTKYSTIHLESIEPVK